MLNITLLKNHPEFIPVLAKWAYDEWFITRSIEYELVVKLYKQRLNENTLPITWVAMDNDDPVGMVTLKDNDLQSRSDLNPWLSALYTIPEKRNQGIANALINVLIGKAAGLKYRIIYLFLGNSGSVDLGMYYSRRGWIFLDDAMDNNGLVTKIFYYDTIKQ